MTRRRAPISWGSSRGRRVAEALCRLSCLVALACSLAGARAEAGDPEAGQRKAMMCMPCHGLNGVGRNPTVPNIAGESELYLTKQLKAFRSGERRHEQMSIVASSLGDVDIANLAAWYSAIRFSVELPD